MGPGTERGTTMGNDDSRLTLEDTITGVCKLLSQSGVMEVEAKQVHRAPRKPEVDADGNAIVLHDVMSVELRASKIDYSNKPPIKQ